jgi:hypothetical protein
MKIVSESADQLVAVDKNLAALAVGPVLGLAGLLMAILGQNLIAGLLGFALMAGGVYVVVMREVRTVLANKGAAKVSIQTKSLLRTRLNEYLFHDIAKVKLTTRSVAATNDTAEEPAISLNLGGLNGGHAGHAKAAQQTDLVFVLNNGTEAEVASGSQRLRLNSLIGRGTGGKLSPDVGQRLAAFVGVPFEKAGEVDAAGVGAGAAGTGAVAGAPAPVEPAAAPPVAAPAPAAPAPAAPPAPAAAVPAEAVPSAPAAPPAVEPSPPAAAATPGTPVEQPAPPPSQPPQPPQPQ